METRPTVAAYYTALISYMYIIIHFIITSDKLIRKKKIKQKSGARSENMAKQSPQAIYCVQPVRFVLRLVITDCVQRRYTYGRVHRNIAFVKNTILDPFHHTACNIVYRIKIYSFARDYASSPTQRRFTVSNTYHVMIML